jgi:hypothetical protein
LKKIDDFVTLIQLPAYNYQYTLKLRTQKHETT